MNIKDLRVGTPIIYHGKTKTLTHIVGFTEVWPNRLMVIILLDGIKISVSFSKISIADFEIPENPVLEEILDNKKQIEQDEESEGTIFQDFD